MILCK